MSAIKLRRVSYLDIVPTSTRGEFMGCISAKRDATASGMSSVNHQIQP